jgi:Domain of unknown function (DUF4386)
MGAFFEVMLVIGLIGTAVALYPIVKRQNDRVALGYVRGRLREAAVIVVGTLLVPTLARSSPFGKSLVAIHDWTFLRARPRPGREHVAARVLGLDPPAQPPSPASWSATYRGARFEWLC